MNVEGDFKRLGHTGNLPGGSLLGRLLAFVIGSAALVGALVFSAVLFIVLAAIGLIAGVFIWWKTRELRKQMRAQMQHMEQAMRARQQDLDGAQPDIGGARPGFGGTKSGDVTEGDVIEGEFVRERGSEDTRR